MKFATTTVVALLSGLASADYYTSVLCTAPTVTVTFTETACNTYPGSYVTQPPAPPATNPPYITTANGQVTSCDYGSDSRSTVYVYPTGKPSYDAICGVYQQISLISLVVVHIDVVVNNYGQTTTVTSTKTDHPTWTPPPPPPPTYTPPVYTNSSSTYSSPTGYNTSTSSPYSSYPTGYSSSFSSSSSNIYSSSNSSSSTYASSSSTPYSTGSYPIYTTSHSSSVPTYSISAYGSSSSAKIYSTPSIHQRGNRAVRREA